jgi:quinone-modifying oxidoreductase, subunit QmoC
VLSTFGRHQDMGSKSHRIDFGWRLGGRVVTVLSDLSFDLRNGSHSPGSFLEPYCPDVRTLRTCLQCGACTASCELAEKGSIFPRRQMTLVQLGLDERVTSDPAIWCCYDCNDCSSHCPSQAKPGPVMRALRHLAVERFSFPSLLARAMNDWRSLGLVFTTVAGLLAVLIGATGRFSLTQEPVRYASMFPHVALEFYFFTLAGLVLIAMGIGLDRSWRAWQKQPLGKADAAPFLHALRHAVRDVFSHRKFAQCAVRPARRWAHLGLFSGSIGLFAVTTAVAALLLLGFPYPLSFQHPLKLVGNLFALMLIGGALYFLAARLADTARGERSALFDWVLVPVILLVGVTGVAAEAFRYLDVRSIAYPVYFSHLLFVTMLFLSLPFSKLAHAAYRTLAVTSRYYDSIVSPERAKPPARAGAGQRRRSCTPPLPADSASVADPASFLRLNYGDLTRQLDATLSAAYYQLRDESSHLGERRYFPNIKRLFGTAFEREQDRRELRALATHTERREVP